jgi:DNA-binding MarR family transcriptional regulator
MTMANGAGATETWKLLVELTLRLRSRWVALAAQFDLTPIQAMALRSLDPDRPLPMNLLAENLVCDPSNVTGIVDKLEARGLLERQAAEHDRRVKMLAVTAKGARLRRKFIERALEPPIALRELPAGEQRCLHEALSTLLRRWQEGAEAAE